MAAFNLGEYLKYGRTRAHLSVTDVSRELGVAPFEVVGWERNNGEALQLKTVNKLIQLYKLDVEIVFDLILKYQLSRIEGKLQRLVQKESSNEVQLAAAAIARNDR